MKKKVNGGIMLYFLGLQNHCEWWLHHGIKGCLLLWRKAMTNLDSILKSRDITLLTKVLIVKTMVSPIIIHRCESWTIKKAEGQRIDSFELWCWRRLLRVPWTTRSNQSILKEVSQPWIFIGRTDWCWSWSSSPLAIWCKELILKKQKTKNPYAGKDWGQEEERATEDEMVGWHHLTQWTWVWANFRKWWRTGKPVVLQSMGLQRVGRVWVNNKNNNVLWSVQVVCQISEQRPHGSEGQRCEVIWRKCVWWTEITPRWKDL